MIVNGIGLLSFMLGASETTREPDVPPAGIVIVIEESAQELTAAAESLRKTWLPPWDAPKPEPLRMTCAPTGPVVAEAVVIMGEVAPPDVRETLSNVAVPRLEVECYYTANPM